MNDQEQLSLVEKALLSGLAGCVEWHPNEADRVRRDFALQGLSPEAIRKYAIKHVQGGGSVRQVKETREHWKNDRDFWYMVVIPIPDLFKKGLFVEMELFDADPELPEVRLLNAHEQY